MEAADAATIAALATPPGVGGISIVRISGPRAMAVAASLFRPRRRDGRRQKRAGEFLSHRLYLGEIRDPESGRRIEEVLLAVMRAPRSYTREDVVEIHSHGSPAAVRAILDLVLSCGCRLAQPGEFTRRAFLNGRIDLTQAEAVIDVIQAKSRRALEAAAAMLDGTLSQEIGSLRRVALEVLAALEAAIEFGEEIDEPPAREALAARLKRELLDPVGRLLLRHETGRPLREGLRIAIAGRPNVGKSSLLNRLLGRERAIVSPHPGTTRDAVEDLLLLQGIPLSLWDTAGLREPADALEAVGIEKSWEAVASADLVLFVLEAGREREPEDEILFARLRDRPVIAVHNKRDLLPQPPPCDWPPTPRVLVSARTGEGLEELRRLLAATLDRREAEVGGDVVPNLRHKLALERSAAAVEAAVELLAREGNEDLAAWHLNEALQALEEIVGGNATADVLEAVFSRFCIGK